MSDFFFIPPFLPFRCVFSSAGQCYIISRDVCDYIVEEAPYSKMRIGAGGYVEGHEDHDISAMAMHSPTPLTLITIGKSQRFWEHPVNREKQWHRIVQRETSRMKEEEFEGKMLRLY